jgi:hypothetical protein
MDAKTILVLVLLGLGLIGVVILWITSLIKKSVQKAYDKEQERLLAEERAKKVKAEKAAIDGKTPEQIRNEMPKVEQDAIEKIKNDAARDAAKSILDIIKKKK